MPMPQHADSFSGSRPMKMLRAIDISGPSPCTGRWSRCRARMASLAAMRSSTSLPSTKISPCRGWCAPERILISVDLPAPLSPTRPTTSARSAWKSTPLSAWTPPYHFSRPSQRISASALGWTKRREAGACSTSASVMGSPTDPPRARRTVVFRMTATMVSAPIAKRNQLASMRAITRPLSMARIRQAPTMTPRPSRCRR